VWGLFSHNALHKSTIPQNSVWTIRATGTVNRCCSTTVDVNAAVLFAFYGDDVYTSVHYERQASDFLQHFSYLVPTLSSFSTVSTWLLQVLLLPRKERVAKNFSCSCKWSPLCSRPIIELSTQFTTLLVETVPGDYHTNTRCSNGIHILTVNGTNKPDHISLTKIVAANQGPSPSKLTNNSQHMLWP
jgi:hypothetical protein